MIRYHLSVTAGSLVQMALVCPELALRWECWQKHVGFPKRAALCLWGPTVGEEPGRRFWDPGESVRTGHLFS